MNENLKKANKIKFDTILKNFEKRGIKGYYCETKEEAAKMAMSFVEEGAKVACGGSETVNELGLKGMFADKNATLIDPNAETDEDKKYAKRVETLGTDVYFMSSNAVTMDGKLVNIDGTGNRVAALCYGPKKVVLIVGYNKVVESEEQAISRIKNDACPANCIKLGKKTPCATAGKCAHCLSMGNTVCSLTVTTRFCSTGRLHVILVNESMGF